MKRFINKKGGALPLVLVVLVVLSILGVAFLGTSISEYRSSAFYNDKIKAYYIAKSGAEATAAWMTNPDNDGEVLLDKSSTTPSTLTGIDGSFTVDVMSKSDTEILISATGTVNNVSEKVGLIVYKSSIDGSSSVFPYGLAATGKIDIRGNVDVYGSVAASEDEKIVIQGSSSVTEKIITPINSMGPTFPADPTTASDYTYSGAPLDITTEPEQTIVFNKFSMNANKETLKINTGAEGNIVKLVVDELEIINGNLVIEGNGRLYIFVKTRASFLDNTNSDGKSEQLIVFLGKGAIGDFPNNKNHEIFTGFVYGPEATVNLNGGCIFKGGIIAETIDCEGTSRITYDTDAAGDITFDMLPIPHITEFTKGPWQKQ